MIKAGGNKAPIAVAGPNQVIALPKDSILLDGSASSDLDGKISDWFWTEISGPSSAGIVNKTAATTVVRNLGVGTYQFELKITDDGGLSSKDTLNVSVVETLSGKESIYYGIWGCNDICGDGDVYWDSSPWDDGLYANPDANLAVSIRLGTSSDLIEVRRCDSPLPPINQFCWKIDRGYLWVFAYEGKLIGTPVTIQVKFQ